MPAAETSNDPVRVQIVPVETAPVERRTITSSFVASSTPQQILPNSNKRIQAQILVTGMGTCYICDSYAEASDAASSTASDNSGAIVQAPMGPIPVVGTGALWLALAAGGPPVVGVISEYEV